MKKQISTVEDAIAHAEKYGRDWSTDRAVKHADPENKSYWNIPENPNNSKLNNEIKTAR